MLFTEILYYYYSLYYSKKERPKRSLFDINSLLGKEVRT